MNNHRIGVLHLIDTLHSGGAETVAVNLANATPRDLFTIHLCATHEGGPLEKRLAPDINYYCLHRKYTFDIIAIAHLIQYIKKHDIRIIHAHSSSLFVAYVIRLFFSEIRVLWHDHFGAFAIETRPAWIYKKLAKGAHGEVAVTRTLVNWSVSVLKQKPNRVWYIPNFVPNLEGELEPIKNLPGKEGKRIICVANFRPQKDHDTLLQAMKQVVSTDAEAHLILVGAETEFLSQAEFYEKVKEYHLQNYVSWLGKREDVPSILVSCDIGVLSSISEGFPLVLLEYGMANLAVVATRVGECEEILEGGRAGLLVPPSDPFSLAKAILHLINHNEERKQLGLCLSQRVNNSYSEKVVVEKLVSVYHKIIS
ncbi:MAG: glycosyltransferase family 4 protein [Candidatus Atribacteria bacterium]|nr:glycosyltransferase family 4 protein [Candidatus Atribacteria bacterium]